MVKRTTAQMKPRTFNLFDPISIIEFVKNFELASDTNEVHECAAMSLFDFLMNKTASAVLNAQISAEHTDKQHSQPASGKTRYFTSYRLVVNFSLNNFATDQAVAETNSEIMCFPQPSGVTPSQYGNDSLTKPLCCADVYKDCALNKICIKDSDASSVAVCMSTG